MSCLRQSADYEFGAEALAGVREVLADVADASKQARFSVDGVGV
jgi:hypothetical protein